MRLKRVTEVLRARARDLPDDASRSVIRCNLFIRATRCILWNTPRSMLLGDGENADTGGRTKERNSNSTPTQLTQRLLEPFRTGLPANSGADEPAAVTQAERDILKLNICRGDAFTLGLRKLSCTTHSLTRDRTVYSEDSLCVPRMILLSRGTVTTRGHNLVRSTKFH
jgi:hypothetical protein